MGSDVPHLPKYTYTLIQLPPSNILFLVNTVMVNTYQIVGFKAVFIPIMHQKPQKLTTAIFLSLTMDKNIKIQLRATLDVVGIPSFLTGMVSKAK